MAESFHRRGHHIQRAHGRRGEFAADGSHLSGGMIALMPTAADAKRLAFPGGEKAADLHCTLLFLGDDGSVWTEEQRSALEDAVRRLVAGVPPVNAKIFGVAHWNGDSDQSSWVWSVGDSPDNGLADADLAEARALAATAATMTMDLPEIPQQHTPWVAHICAAYSGDLTVVRSLEKRLGPVTFDRIRLSFGDDDRDIPLSGTAVSLTAAGLRRDPHEHERHVDYTGHTAQWTEAVRTAAGRMSAEMADWREQIHKQILAGADTPEELAGLTVETTEAADILSAVMHTLARGAGDALVKEARKQGVEIPAWSLPDDTVTAAVGGQRLLRSVAQMTSDLLATNMVQSARRFVTGMLGRDTTPEALASAVDERLQEGQEQAAQGPIGTAMSAAQTAGREAVLRAAPPGSYYSSEILDGNTCGPCKEVDGEQFDSLEIAIKAYPVMGYKDCVGPKYGNSCRGMIVATWRPEETEPVTAAGAAFHGTPGDPGYPALHPKGGTKGKRKTGSGGMVGSDHFSEEEHYRALTRYIDDSMDINDWLRTGDVRSDEMDNEQAEEYVKAIMDMVEIQTPSRLASVQYRGMREDILKGLKPGDEFHDRGFISTTSSVAVAKDFAGSEGILVRIKIPGGTKLLNVDKVEATDPQRIEKESILQAGTRFRIVSVRAPNADSPVHYVLEVIQ